MSSINKIHAVDHVFDYIPVVSTFTNAGILLLKLAMKVNLVANPMGPGLWGDLKIHAVEKSALDAFMTMIPIFNIFYTFADNFTLANLLNIMNTPYDYLKRIIVRSEIDKIKCHLVRYPMKAHELTEYLGQANCSSKPEVVSFFLDYCKWTRDQIVDGLTTWVSAKSIRNMNLCLDRWGQFSGSELSQDSLKKLQRVMIYLFKEVDNEDSFKLGNRIFGMLPQLEETDQLQEFMRSIAQTKPHLFAQLNSRIRRS